MEHAQQLLECYNMVAQWEEDVIIQEWIPGGDDRIAFVPGRRIYWVLRAFDSSPSLEVEQLIALNHFRYISYYKSIGRRYVLLGIVTWIPF